MITARIETANGGRVHIDMRTVGAGGMYSTLRDLAAWERVLEGRACWTAVRSTSAFRAHIAAEGEHGVDTVKGYGYGWIASERYGTEVIWHDGGLAGFHNIILRIPSRRLAVVVLANAPLDQHRLATTIADRLMR